MKDPVLAVIPARLGSTRLPRKPLRLLAGRPMVLHTWERVARLPDVDRVVVATDHEDIASVVRSAGGEAVMTDPGHPSGTDRVAEVSALPGFAGYPLVVNVQGDEPSLLPEHVTGPVALIRDAGWAVTTPAAPVVSAEDLSDPSVVKVVRAEDGRALYFSRAAVPHPRDEPFSPGDARWLHHIGVYVYRRAALERWVAMPPSALELTERLEQLRALEGGLTIGVAIVSEASRGVDTAEDLEEAERRWEAARHATSPDPNSPFTGTEIR